MECARRLCSTFGILANDPFEDRETDREEEVDSEEAADDDEDDLLQQPHAVIIG